MHPLPFLRHGAAGRPLRGGSARLAVPALTLCAALLFASIAQVAAQTPPSQKLTVGPAGSGADFSNLQEAINQAAPGAIISVAPGTYGGVVVQKPLAIIGAGSGFTFLQAQGLASPDPGQPPPPGNPALVVRQIPAGSSVRIFGFRLLPPPGPTTALEVIDCAGTVQIVDVRFEGPFPVTGFGPGRGLADVRQSAAVAFDSCRFVGVANGALASSAANGLSGLAVRSSRISLNQCEIRGNAGLGALGSTLLGSAAPGIWARSSDLVLGRTSVRGGDGGVALFTASAGAAGMWLEDSSALVAGGPGAAVQGGGGKSNASPSGPVVQPGGSAFELVGASAVTFAADLPAVGGIGGGGATAAVTTVGPLATATALAVRLPSARFTPLAPGPGVATAVEIAGSPLSFVWPWLAYGTAPGLALPGVMGALQLVPGEAFPLIGLFLGLDGTATFDLMLPASPALLGLGPALQVLGLAGTQLAFSAPALLTIGG